MKSVLFFCVVVFSMFGNSAYGADEQTRAALEKMFSLTAMDKKIDRLYQRIESEVGHVVAKMDVPPSKVPELERQFRRLSSAMRAQMSWQQLKEPMIEAYSQVFSADEIEQLVAFYQSPVGRKLVEKSPELNDVPLQLIEKQMLLSLLPQVDQLRHEMTVEYAQLD